jgi:acyl-CoA thioester hydrolase
MTETPRPSPEPRDAYRAHLPITTRWLDNDVYGHVNNVVYYAWFDTAVNGHLIAQGALDIHAGSTIGLVVETQCHYFSSIAFPQNVTAGIRVAHIGKSSVRYEVGLFADDQAMCAAKGHFVHVYVNRDSRRPVSVPAELLRVLQVLQA